MALSTQNRFGLAKYLSIDEIESQQLKQTKKKYIFLLTDFFFIESEFDKTDDYE